MTVGARGNAPLNRQAERPDSPFRLLKGFTVFMIRALNGNEIPCTRAGVLRGRESCDYYYKFQ